MIKNTTKGILLSLLVMLFALPAFASGDKGKHRMKMDTNGDGQISASEHASASKARFNRADKNGDGVLDKKEMRKLHKKMKEHKNKRKEKSCDKDSD